MGEADDAYNEGTQLLNVGKPREAIPHFDQAIRLNPRHAEAYTNRGIAWREMGDLSGAITGFDKATELNPKYARAYGDRDITRLLQGKDAEAQKDLAKCFELDQGMRKVFELKRPLIYFHGIDLE
ncbi:MAG: tetratricopeptide repeat protein, partial [candidate division NC10 bacterium]|nr:tetratricopeptide repeat protein [candidate division NC10 bacterium]